MLPRNKTAASSRQLRLGLQGMAEQFRLRWPVEQCSLLPHDVPGMANLHFGNVAVPGKGWCKPGVTVQLSQDGWPSPQYYARDSSGPPTSTKHVAAGACLPPLLHSSCCIPEQTACLWWQGYACIHSITLHAAHLTEDLSQQALDVCSVDLVHDTVDGLLESLHTQTVMSCIIRASLKGGTYTPPVLPAAHACPSTQECLGVHTGIDSLKGGTHAPPVLPPVTCMPIMRSSVQMGMQAVEFACVLASSPIRHALRSALPNMCIQAM
eukprot:1037683-Pelagomonas_calceolata.AAC.2